MHHPLFHIGDRVVTTKPLAGIPRGTRGRVVAFYGDDCYDVLFDGFSGPCYMFASEMALAPLTDTDSEAPFVSR